MGPSGALPPDARMRHDGYGGRPGTAELLTGIERARSRSVRRMFLVDG